MPKPEENWTTEKLNRKIDQESEMMCLALKDGDREDAEIRRQRLDAYRQELRNRRELKSC